MGADDERAFARQEQIWSGLYGPARAAGLVAAARTGRADDPDGDLEALFAAVEPVDDDDLDEAGTMRPGVG